MQAYKQFAISAALVASAGIISEAGYAPTLVADCRHQVVATAEPSSWAMGPHMDTCGDFTTNRPVQGAITISKQACAHDFVAVRASVPKEAGLGALIKFRYLKEVSTTALPLMVILKDEESKDFYSWCVNVQDESIGNLCDDQSAHLSNLLPNQWHDLLVDFDDLSRKTGRPFPMNAELVLNVYAEDAMEPVTLEVYSVKFVREQTNWLQNCMNCQDGFHLMVSSGSALCYENECLCAGGVGARGAACATHGSEACVTCPSGYVHSGAAGGCVEATPCAVGYVRDAASGDCVQVASVEQATTITGNLFLQVNNLNTVVQSNMVEYLQQTLGVMLNIDPSYVSVLAPMDSTGLVAGNIGYSYTIKIPCGVVYYLNTIQAANAATLANTQLQRMAGSAGLNLNYNIVQVNSPQVVNNCAFGGAAYTGASALPEEMTVTSSRIGIFAGSVVGSFFAVGAFVGARAWKSRQCAPAEPQLLAPEVQEEAEATA